MIEIEDQDWKLYEVAIGARLGYHRRTTKTGINLTLIKFIFQGLLILTLSCVGSVVIFLDLIQMGLKIMYPHATRSRTLKIQSSMIQNQLVASE